jgi:Family of unknown function (DUF5681)
LELEPLYVDTAVRRWQAHTGDVASGNTRGRPRVGRDHASVFHNVMDTKIAITVNGRQRMVSGFEAVLLRLRQDAMNGKPPAQKQLMWLFTRFPTLSEPASDLTTEECNELFGKYDAAKLQTIREFSDKEQAVRDQKRKRKV